MHRKIITILIMAVFTAGLIMGFGDYVFAGDPVPGLDITIEQNPGGRVSAKNYKSSLSNTKSIGQVRMEVGDILLRYGIGGADINKVTEALEGGGVYEAELKSFLIAIGINEEGVQKILLEFDGVGISKDSAQTVSTPGAGDAPQPAIVDTEKHRPPTSATTPTTGEPTPATGPFIKIQGIPGISTPTTSLPDTTALKNIELIRNTIGKIQERLKGCDNAEVCDIVDRHAKGRKEITDTTKEAIENRNWEEATRLLREVRGIVVGDIELLEGAGDRGLIADVLGLERSLLHQTDLALQAMVREAARQSVEIIRESAKTLRDNFRENVRTTIGHVDHGKTARIAVAHGKGLRMINRYRSAIARFDHILGRLESRVEKIRIETEAQTRSVNIAVKINNKATSVILLIEEAKNMQVENEAKLAELKAKYELLLLGKNPGGIAEEARAIAKELKSEIEKLHGLLDDIKQAGKDYNSSISNSSK